jgi:NAD(P)-dependent dehydrogenase (short-subunit alcohol dehydrogenase family)
MTEPVGMTQTDSTQFDFTGPLDFTNMSVIVTGGTRGIGLGIAEAFLKSGADVMICGRSAPGGETGLPSSGGRTAVFSQADIRDPEQATRLIEETISRFGRLDVLVNNAGGSPAAPAADASPRFIKSVVELNLLAPFFCAQAANAVMQQQAAGGSIVNIGSVSGTRPSPGTAAYGAAKAGLANLTATLAVEWAPRVRVNCLVGGLIATAHAEDHYGGPEGLAAVSGTVPLGRMGTPRDIAWLCLFLASPLASYVSGAVLVAHGGGERPAYLTALEAQRSDLEGHQGGN